MIPIEAARKFKEISGIEVKLDTIASLASNRPTFDMFDLNDKLKLKYPDWNEDSESLCDLINRLWPEQGENLVRNMCNIQNVK